MAKFYFARSRTIPPLPWQTFALPFSHKTKNRVVAAYARSDLLDKRRDLMQLWAVHLAQTSATVIKIGGVA